MTNKVKILYVDDEELNLQLFKINFSSKYDIVTGCCGKTGLECLEINPDIRIVFSDLKMPNMNGFEFITEAKKLYNDKLFFILTGIGISEDIRNALESKLIVNYFRKPYNKSQILSELEKFSNTF